MRLPPAAEALLALPPRRFTAERDALARALAARGDADAGPVRRLRRPVGLSWVMNRLARERPRGVEALLEAGERLRAGQRHALAGRGSIDLRSADGDLREAARQLRVAAEPLAAERGKAAAPAELARLELLLRVAATAPGPVREGLRRGVLEREPDIAAPDLSGLSLLSSGGAPAQLSEPMREGGRAISGRVASSERSERAGPVRDREAEARRERIVREKRLALAKAARQGLARAEARAARTASTASAAEARARAARARADVAKAEVERRREALADLQRQP